MRGSEPGDGVARRIAKFVIWISHIYVWLKRSCQAT